MDVFSPASKKQEKAGSPGDVFSPALEIRNAGSQGDCISPTQKLGRVGMFSEYFYPYAKNKDRK